MKSEGPTTPELEETEMLTRHVPHSLITENRVFVHPVNEAPSEMRCVVITPDEIVSFTMPEPESVDEEGDPWADVVANAAACFWARNLAGESPEAFEQDDSAFQGEDVVVCRFRKTASQTTVQVVVSFVPT